MDHPLERPKNIHFSKRIVIGIASDKEEEEEDEEEEEEEHPRKSVACFMKPIEFHRTSIDFLWKPLSCPRSTLAFPRKSISFLLEILSIS